MFKKLLVTLSILGISLFFITQINAQSPSPNQTICITTEFCCEYVNGAANLNNCGWALLFQLPQPRAYLCEQSVPQACLQENAGCNPDNYSCRLVGSGLLIRSSAPSATQPPGSGQGAKKPSCGNGIPLEQCLTGQSELFADIARNSLPLVIVFAVVIFLLFS